MISQAFAITDVRQKVVFKDNQNKHIYMQVAGNSTVYVGGADVTDSNGMPVKKHESFHDVLVPLGEELYAVCATGVTETLLLLLPDGD